MATYRWKPHLLFNHVIEEYVTLGILHLMKHNASIPNKTKEENKEIMQPAKPIPTNEDSHHFL
jgi:hypothetical protein